MAALDTIRNFCIVTASQMPMGPNGDQLTSDLAALKIDREERPKRGILKTLIWLALIAGLAAALVLSVYPYLKSRVFKADVTATEVGLISPAQQQVELTTTGYIQALTTGKVAAKVVGRIAKLTLKEGDPVRKGDVIAQLEDTQQRSQVAAARARAQTARARVAMARAQLAETSQQVAREKALAEKGVSPRATYDDLTAKQRSQSEAVRAAEAEVASADADVTSLEVNLQDMTVTSPIDGIIVTKNCELGELVGPQTGTTIFDIVDFDSLVVEVDVPESKLRMVKVGTPGEVVLDAFPDRRFRGELLEMGKKVDRAKATVKVKVKFIDPPVGALPDMAARVNFLDKQLDAASMKEPPKVVVPISAVVERGGGTAIFVIDNGKAHLTNVQLGDKLGENFVVRAGPTPGTKIIANPSDNLRDGQPIQEKND